jgi:uncharacterized membrane protein YfcA
LEKLKMPSLEAAVIVLAGIALFAAFVNGAIGYGFSSLTVPVALVFYTNRILNPAVVVIEVFVNLYVLFINLSGVPAVWKRVFPILVGLLPGIAVGAFVLALLEPGWIKFGTYTVILPLILVQAAGWRRPIRSNAQFAAIVETMAPKLDRLLAMAPLLLRYAATGHA